MTANLAAWSLQVIALVLVAAGLLGLLRITAPRARLACWRLLLLACLALPALQPWEPMPVVDAAVSAVTAVTADDVVPVEPVSPWPFDPKTTILLVLAAGTLARLSWLGAGFVRLARYRRTATPLSHLSDLLKDASTLAGAGATLGLSDRIDGPVTFGLHRPFVLVPRGFLDLDAAVQRAVLCHELRHVRRRDWAWSMAEEVVCALLWFNPAVWWLVAQIHLSREQVVDRDVVRLTGARKPYLEALLGMSNVTAHAELVPATLFLRKRHLARRMRLLLTEAAMSTPRLVVSFATLACVLAIAGRAAVEAFPLISTTSTAPALTTSAPGASPKLVDLPMTASEVQQEPVRVGGDVKPPKKIHDVRPVYPADASEAGVQGVVILEVTIAPDGTVSDTRVLRSIPMLDQAAADAVRQWGFTPTLLNGEPVPVVMTVTVNFTLEGGPGPDSKTDNSPDVARLAKPVYPAEAVAAKVQGTVVLDAVIGASGKVVSVKLVDGPGLLARSAIATVRTWGFSTITSPHAARIEISYGLAGGEPNVGWLVKFSPLDQAPAKTPTSAAPAPKLVVEHEVKPVYPPDARAAGITGTVEVELTVDADGKVVDARAISGPAELHEAAVEAALQWRFKAPGRAVQIDIEFAFTLKDD